MSLNNLHLLAAAGGLVGGLVSWSAKSYLRAHGLAVDRRKEVALFSALVGASGGVFASLMSRAMDMGVPGDDPTRVALLAFVAGFWSQNLMPDLEVAGMRGAMDLDTIEQDIRDYIQECSERFNANDADSSVWVAKYLAPRWLGSFMARGQLGISRTPGFTWGDGVYVTPLDHAYSSAMYGRACIVGFVDRADLQRVYDGADPKGLSLYQRWIRTQTTLYRQLTTTIHADVANRELRNIFRVQFGIDLVIFEPDEQPAGYSSALDRWYCVSDWTTPQAGQQFTPTARVRECRFVAIIGEEFSQEKYKVDWPRYFAPTVGTGAAITWVDVTAPTALPAAYKAAHTANAPPSGATPPHPVKHLVHVRPVR